MGHLNHLATRTHNQLSISNQSTLLEQPQLLKEAHTKCMIFADGVIKPVIFFNRPDVYELLAARKDEPFSLAVQATENHFNGRVSVELFGLDIAV